MRSNPFLSFSENTRPAWTFRPGDYFRGQGKAKPAARVSKFVLIPTLEHTLEDGLLLMALVLFHDQPWGMAASRIQDGLLKDGRLEIYSIYDSQRAEALEEARKRSVMFPKMILSVFGRDSLIYSQIDALRHYQHEMSVCMPVFTRSYSQWSSRPDIKGTLEGQMPMDSS